MGYKKETDIIILMLLTCCLAPVTSQQGPGVRLLWRGVQYPNNSIVRIEDVGEGVDAIACQTDRRPCCRTPFRIGEWYYPNGSRVPTLGEGATFYRNRNYEGLVLLNRRPWTYDTASTGLFCCILPDASDVIQTMCIGLLPTGGSINTVSYNATSFIFSCVTSGGIATYANEDDCGNKQRLVSFSQRILDPLTLRYNNELRWGSQSQGSYICSIRNRESVSYAVLLTEFAIGIDQGLCSSQIIGTLGQELTLLCLGNEPVTGAVWMTPDGMRASNNITFAHLSTSNAGVYTCRGTIQGRIVSSVIDLRISNCSGLVYINGIPATINITQSYSLSCDTFYWETGCYSIEEEYYFYHGDELISRNKSFVYRADSISGVLNNHYFCTVTVNGSNFTSSPAHTSSVIQLPSPSSVSISSDMDNPIPSGSSPTLSCTVSLHSAVDIEVEIVTEWSGHTYGLREYTTTEPVRNSSAEVPTYTSTAQLNAPGTYYDSGDYYCLVVINPLNKQNFIQSDPIMANTAIPVLFLYPHRIMLLNINQVGANWILVTWKRNRATDNISNYRVTYSYVGECTRTIGTRMVDGANSSYIISYNITGLGAYYNYNITLIAMNGTGRSPPHTVFSRTSSTAPTGTPRIFIASWVFSTNITVQWQRVICNRRNSEITHYLLQYSLVGSDNIIKEVKIFGTDDSNRMYTANRLQPLSEYTFTIAAVNSRRQRGPNATRFITTPAPESVVFQLQLSGVHNCLQWRISDPEDKVHDILVGIASGVNQQCRSCELEHTNITDGEFQCFPGSPNQVTFRAKVHDRAQATAREVITYIEQWITSSESDVVTIPVHHARLNINNTCVILLSSLDDPECPGYLNPPSQTTTNYVPLSKPAGTLDQSVSTTSSIGDDTYSSTAEVTSALSSQSVPTGSTSQPMTITDNQLITPPQLTTGTLNQSHTVTTQNERETVDKQLQFDVGAIVGTGGAVIIVFIITAGIVVVLVLYIVLKYRQSAKQLSPQAKNAEEGQLKIATKPSAKIEDSYEDEMYEVIEMQATSEKLAKTRYAPAQMPQEGLVEIQPIESENEASKDSAGKGDINQEAYEVINVD